MNEFPIIIEEVNDPAVIARCKAQDERTRRNSEWLQGHWADLLPQACGKFIAVAGQEAFISDTPGRPGGEPALPTPTMTAPSVSTSSRREGRGSMLIPGEWRLCEDGVTRPAVKIKVESM